MRYQQSFHLPFISTKPAHRFWFDCHLICSPVCYHYTMAALWQEQWVIMFCMFSLLHLADVLYVLPTTSGPVLSAENFPQKPALMLKVNDCMNSQAHIIPGSSITASHSMLTHTAPTLHTNSTGNLTTLIHVHWTADQWSSDQSCIWGIVHLK